MSKLGDYQMSLIMYVPSILILIARVTCRITSASNEGAWVISYLAQIISKIPKSLISVNGGSTTTIYKLVFFLKKTSY